MQKVNLEFTELEIFNDHVIVRVADSIELDLCKYHQIMEVLADHFKESFGIILDEVNSHSISFDVMRAMRDNKNVICCAIVSYRYSTMISLAQSLRLLNKPGTFCGSVDDAQSWVKDRMVEWRKNGVA